MPDERESVAPAWRMPRQPVFYAALAYAVGTLIGAGCWRPMSWWAGAAVVGIVAAVALRKAGVKGQGPRARVVASVVSLVPTTVVLLAFVALGALGIRARNGADVHPDLRQVTDGREVVLTGYVVRDGAIRGTGSQRRESLDVRIESVEVPGATDAAGERGPETLIKRDVDAKAEKADRFARAVETRRRRAACKANSVWSPELLRASGVAPCKEEDTPRHKVKRPTLRFTKDGAPSGLVESPKDVVTVNTVVRLSIYSRDRWEESDDGDEGGELQVYRYGERLRFSAKLRPPRNFGNPGALDYEGYLADRGIYALGSTRMDRIEVLEGIGGSRWGRWRSGVRRSVVAKIHSLWPAEQAALLDAMLIGEASFIGRDTKADFQRTGIYHILVVSGMNVGILATVIFWVLRKIRVPQIIAVVLTFVLSCGYAYVADAGAPIMRPVIMLAIFMCARLLYRDGAMLNSLGIAALALLVFDPKALIDASFQLTFLSVLAIVGIAVPILERTSAPYRRALRQLDLVAKDMSLAPRSAQFRIELRMLTSRVALFLPGWPDELRGLPNKVLRERVAQRALTTAVGAAISAYDLFVVSAIAQIALTLPMAWYFHRVPVMSLPANLIAVPLVGVLMPTAVSAVVIGYVWKPLAYVPSVVASWSLGWIGKAVTLFSSMHAADVRVANPEMVQAFTAALAFALVLVLVRRKKLVAMAGVATMLASALWIAVIGPQPSLRKSVLEVTSIDVGQAESSLVVTPEGKTVLVDAGGSLGPFQSEFDFGEDVVSPYLWARGISRLDSVCLTHAHSDHLGGMRAVIQNFRPRELWMGPTPDVPEIRALLKQAEDAGMKVKRHAAGDKFDFGGASVMALSPPPDWVPGPKNRNDDSLVLRFSYGQTSAILEADAEKPMEELMARWVPASDLIKVAHNGSKTSSTPEFLAAVRPRYAVISVGARNSFGHPRREVLERLAETGVSTYRTDRFGAVTFYLDGRQVTPMVRSHPIQ